MEENKTDRLVVAVAGSVDGMMRPASEITLEDFGGDHANYDAWKKFQASAEPQQVDAVQAVPEAPRMLTTSMLRYANHLAACEAKGVPSMSLHQFAESESGAASPSPAVPPEPQCAMCNDSGVVGRHPDDFQECPDCIAARTAAQADEPTSREALIACLGDDAVTLLAANPDDEMAQTMQEAAAMLEADGAAQGVVPEALISAAGRALADRSAASCNVDKDDNWKVYGNDFIEDARAAFKAAGLTVEQPTDTTAGE